MKKEDVYNSKAAFKMFERLDEIIIDYELHENIIGPIISKSLDDMHVEIDKKNKQIEGASFLVDEVFSGVESFRNEKGDWEGLEEELKNKIYDAIKKADTFDEMAYYLIEDGVSPSISIALISRCCDYIEDGTNLAQEVF